jgi:hypothetical protein
MTTIVALLLAFHGAGLTGAQPKLSEYDIKAAYLFNFAQFVQWPEKAFEDESTPFTVGVLGADPYGKTLERLASMKQIQGREIVIERYSKIEELERCHILFIARNRERRLPAIFEELKDRCVLTVSETRSFAFDGGIINFIIVDDRIRFEINLQAAERADLTLSSKLLGVARVIKD